MKHRDVILSVASVGAVLALSGCSSVNTPPDMVALHYSGGGLSSQKFVECIPGSTRDNMTGWSEHYYYFPTRVVSYDASGGKGAEAEPFKVVSKDNAELFAPVTVNFTLDTSCVEWTDPAGKKWSGGKLQAFWETIGRKYSADVDPDSQVSDGWITMLNYCIGKPFDTTYDRQAQDHNWRALWNDPATKAKIETSLDEALPELVRRQCQGDWFSSFDTLVLKPDPVNPELKTAIAREQTDVANAQAAEAKARADKARAVAEVALKEAEAAGLAARIKVLGVDGYLKERLVERGLNPYQPSYGGGTLVDAK